MAPPLTALNSINLRFHWSLIEKEKAFQMLKSQFTTTTILLSSNSKLQFKVEVDALDVGAGLSCPCGPP